MRHLGIDVGTKKVGIAISDDSGKIAFPFEVAVREKAVGRIKEIIQEKNIQRVVIGESLDLQGKKNPVMKDVQEIADALKNVVEVALEAEQFSTLSAKRLGEGRDDQAAAIILQSHLDRSLSDDDILFE